jgi:sugar diacid utilization regulator
MRASDNGHGRSLEDIRTLVDRLRAREAEIAQAIFARVQEAVPTAVDGRDPAYQAGVFDAVAAVLDHGLEAMAHEPGWSGSIPDEATAQARRAAHAGTSSSAVVRRYVAGHRLLGEFVAAEAKRIGISGDAAALDRIRRTRESLLENLIAVVEYEHDQERRRIAHSPEQRRAALVSRLLNDEPVGQTELADLGYRFDAWHVGVIVNGPSARETLESLKTDRQLLSLPQGEETVWAWLGGQRRLANSEMERLGPGSEPLGVLLSIGEPGTGLEGWRRTHRQAQEALRVALLSQAKRTRYADIALLTPWLQDPDGARSLVELYLSPLNGQKDGGSTARQTLRACLEANRNVSLAARQLGIDRRTLTHRLDRIEACLGYEIDRRKAELEVALRLHDLLKCHEMHKPAPNSLLSFPTLG